MRQTRSHKREPTIALINVVFLMLVFFMVAGTLAQPTDAQLQLVKTADLDRIPPANVLVIQSDGHMLRAGKTIETLAVFYARLPDPAKADIRVMPDRALPAARLIELAAELSDLGAGKVLIIAERAGQ